MKYACQYAVIRFMPYVETGEFANIGVVLLCPKTGYFDFKLLTRIRRITAFFEELDANVYRAARNALRDELQRIRAVAQMVLEPQQSNTSISKHLFAELTRTRESIIRFAEPRVLMADDPEQELNRVFEHAVGRAFATKSYQEKILEKHVQGMLRAADLVQAFKPRRIGNETYHANFPFVRLDREGNPTKAIKPLHLAQDDPAAIFDHGWEWLGKLRRLQKEGQLPPEVLFAVNEPSAGNELLTSAFRDVVSELSEAPNAAVVLYEDDDAILDFARR